MISIDEIFKQYKNTLQTKGVSRIEEPYRTIVSVWVVQSILDNGGLEYLFENKFPDGMPIDVFEKSYSNIGANEMAKILKDAYEHYSNSKEFGKHRIQKLDNRLFELSSDSWEKLDNFLAHSKGQ